MPHEPFESRDLAGEYVLGVLGADERRAAAARIESDRGFASDVAWWENRLAPLAGAIAPVAPPAYVWERIRAALGHERIAPARTPQREESPWQRVNVWRWLTAGALAVATASMLALYVGKREVPAPVAPAPLVAIMVLDSGAPAFVATIDRAAGTMIITPVTAWTDGQHVPELWLIPKGEKPRSLGVVDTTKPITITVPADLRRAIDPASIVAISVEPPGGSPTGDPTGPVIAKGGISNI
ncbi:MAG: anti-sigma factor [Rhodanobacteraceae bacterium]